MVVGIGGSIDHTMQPRVDTVAGQAASAADALDLLNRFVGQPRPTRQPAQGATPLSIGGLRGLPVQERLSPAFSALPPVPAGSGWTPAPAKSRAAPYARIREREQVLGVLFKIQPPPQAPERPSPGL